MRSRFFAPSLLAFVAFGCGAQSSSPTAAAPGPGESGSETAVVSASASKVLICHVGNQSGPGGETYLENPTCAADCAGDEACIAACPDAGKIDLIEVSNPAKHLYNPSHCYDFDGDGPGEEVCDYVPGEAGGYGQDADPTLGKEDADEDGIDEGCEIPVEEPCPCWDDAAELIEVEPATCSVNEPGQRFVFGGNEQGAYNLNVVNNGGVRSCNWDSTLLGNAYVSPISSEQFDRCYADLAPYCD